MGIMIVLLGYCHSDPQKGPYLAHYFEQYNGALHEVKVHCPANVCLIHHHF